MERSKNNAHSRTIDFAVALSRTLTKQEKEFIYWINARHLSLCPNSADQHHNYFPPDAAKPLFYPRHLRNR